MTILEITREQLDDAVALLEDVTGQDTAEESTVRTDYSGRGMYGGTCLGLVGTTAAAAALLWALCDVTGYELPDLLSELAMRDGWKEDSMGLQAIHYWPGITVTG